MVVVETAVCTSDTQTPIYHKRINPPPCAGCSFDQRVNKGNQLKSCDYGSQCLSKVMRDVTVAHRHFYNPEASREPQAELNLCCCVNKLMNGNLILWFPFLHNITFV